MNKNVVLAVAKRDLRSWFANPTAYVFVILFVAACGVALMLSPQFFGDNLANLDTLSEWFPRILVLFVPAVTMGMWTTERSHGTQELLFTLPARDVDILLGKYLAAAGIYSVSLLFTLPLPLALTFLGSPDWGQVFANYVGYWLLGLSLVAVSMLGSQLTHNQTVAFVLGALLVGVVQYGGWLVAVASGSTSWELMGPLGQFREFARGMLPVSGVLLFAGFALAFLYLNLALLARRHWRQGQEGLHGGVRFLALAVGATALTVIAVQALPRFDSTVERIHSLGAESRALLAGLPENRTVYVTAYVSEDTPPRYAQQKRLLLNLVDQFDSLGGARVEKSVQYLTPFSPEAIAAEKNHGIRPMLDLSEQAGGGVAETPLFLAFTVECGTEEVTVPAIERAVPLEYELTRSIRVVSNAERKKVGLLKTDVDFDSAFDFQAMSYKTRWQIADELKQQYKIENVDPASEYPAGLQCLVVPQPSSLTQEQMDRLKTWIEQGNPTLLLEDIAPVMAWGTAIDDQKGGKRNPMMGGMPQGEKGDFQAFLASFALTMPRNDIVWDTSRLSLGSVGSRLPPPITVIGREAAAQDSPITRGLSSVVMMWSGHFQTLPNEKLSVTPLLKSIARTGDDGLNGTLPKYESAPSRQDGAFVFDFFSGPGSGPRPNPYARLVAKPADYQVAVRVAGKAQAGENAAKPVNLVCIADLDLIGNEFFELRRRATDANLRFDNVTFVLNCIDHLIGDETLVELRKRRPALRSLTRVEDAQKVFEKRWADEKGEAEKAADAALQGAQARLDAAVAKIRDDQSIDEQAKAVKIAEIEAAENSRLTSEKERIETEKNRKIQQAAHERDVQRRRIHNQYRVWTILLSILPALAVGVMTFVRRRAREAAIVPQSRMVQGGAR